MASSTISSVNSDSLKLIVKYIDALIQNINKDALPKEIDLIFDSGGFNGLYGQGVALYIRALERKYNFTVKRVSGASIGSLLALMYLTNIEYNLDTAYIKIKQHFNKTCTLSEYKNQIALFVNKHITEDMIADLTNKLYITYYDIECKKQNIISKYENKNHLIDCIVRSSHIPFLSENTLCYKDKYLDGGHPHIFLDKVRPCLFVRLITPLNLCNVFSSRGEKNTQSRVICGISDANTFFINGSSKLCSFISNWTLYNYLELRGREFMLYFIIFIFKNVYLIKHYIPSNVSDSIIIQGAVKSCWGLYKDVISHLIT